MAAQRGGPACAVLSGAQFPGSSPCRSANSGCWVGIGPESMPRVWPPRCGCAAEVPSRGRFALGAASPSASSETEGGAVRRLNDRLSAWVGNCCGELVSQGVPPVRVRALRKDYAMAPDDACPTHGGTNLVSPSSSHTLHLPSHPCP